MKLLFCVLSLSLSFNALAVGEGEHEHAAPALIATAADGASVYGSAMPETPEAVALEQVLAKPAGYLNQTQKISGRIGKVCQKAGCWMSLTAGDQAVRVVFGEHAFSIPTDSTGQAVVYGELQEQQISEAMAQHLAEDAGADPKAVKGEQHEYRLVAKSVAIQP